jgi:hypothetical protein
VCVCVQCVLVRCSCGLRLSVDSKERKTEAVARSTTSAQLLLQAAFLQLLLFVSIPNLNKCMKKQSCFGHTSFPLKGFFFFPGGAQFFYLLGPWVGG